MSSTCRRHMELLAHLLKYLQAKITHGLLFAGSEQAQVKSFTDADYANCSDRKSTSETIQVDFRSASSMAVQKARFYDLKYSPDRVCDSKFGAKRGPMATQLVTVQNFESVFQAHSIKYRQTERNMCRTEQRKIKTRRAR